MRARLQRTLGRPFPLEEVSTLTLAKLRELEKESGLTGRPGGGGGGKAAAPEDGSEGVDEASTSAPAPGAKPGSGGAAAVTASSGAAAAALAVGGGVGAAAALKALQQPMAVRHSQSGTQGIPRHCQRLVSVPLQQAVVLERKRPLPFSAISCNDGPGIGSEPSHPDLLS